MGTKKSKEINPEVLRHLHATTKFTKAEIKQWYSGFIKDCPSGWISESTFTKVYSNFFERGTANNFCHHVFRSADKAKRGKISFSDFLEIVNMTLNDVDPREKLEWTFVLYDVDGNGVIDKNEMTEILTAMYDLLGDRANKADMDSPQARTEKIFKIADKNKDQVLTKEEFVVSCMEDKLVSKLLQGRRPKPRQKKT